MWCNGNAMGLLGWTMQIAFWVAVFALIVWAVRSTSAARPEHRSSALEILERRFASGEIDADEYEQRRRLLE